MMLDVPDGLGAQAPVLGEVPVGEKVGVQPVEHCRRDPSQLSTSERGEDVQGEVPPVRVERARLVATLDHR